MSARLLERPCSNCGARDSLEVDAARGEIACSECAIVVLMGMEENESTRFAKDATMADADEDTRGGLDGSHSASRSNNNMSGLNPRMTSLLRQLRERTGCPESVVSEAAEMCRQFAVRQRQQNARVEKPLPLTAACFHVASVFAHMPIPIHEMVAYNFGALSSQDILSRRAAVLGSLNLAERYAFECQQERYISDLLTLYLTRLKWRIQTYHDPVILLRRAIGILRVDRLTREDEVVCSMVLLRLESRVQQALSKLVGQAGLAAEVQWTGTGSGAGVVVHAAQQSRSLDSLLQTLEAATKFKAEDLRRSVDWLQPHLGAILELLNKEMPSTQPAASAVSVKRDVEGTESKKRPRED